MALNVLQSVGESSQKRAMRTLKAIYKKSPSDDAKQQQARDCVDAYLASKGDRKLFKASMQLLDVTLDKSDVSFRNFVIDDSLVPALVSKSDKFRKAEALMDAMNIEDLIVSTTEAALKGVAAGLGFVGVDTAPVVIALRTALHEGKGKHQMALMYAMGLSDSGLDETLRYCNTDVGKRMMHQVPDISLEMAKGGLASLVDDGVQPSAHRQRKMQKLDQLLQLTGTDLDTQCARAELDKNTVLKHLAKACHESDLDEALTFQASDTGRELSALQSRLRSDGEWSYLARPEVKAQLDVAAKQMLASAKAPDPWSALLGHILRMR